MYILTDRSLSQVPGRQHDSKEVSLESRRETVKAKAGSFRPLLRMLAWLPTAGQTGTKTLATRVDNSVRQYTPGAAHISSHASGKLRLVGGFPLDSLAKSGFPSLHMQYSLVKKWIPFITYAGFPREKVDSSIPMEWVPSSIFN